MKRNLISIVCLLALVLCLTACGQRAATPTDSTALASGGVLVLSVNPEIAVEYDENGTVTGVTARNNDALAIINSCDNLIGRETRLVVSELVTAIGNAGYFVEELDGGRRQIVLEIEAGSALPHSEFLDDVVSDIRSCIDLNQWNVPMEVENESDYGLSDYLDTDYGPENDGVTDFGATDFGLTDFGATDFGATDFGPNTSNYGTSDYLVTVTPPPATGGSTGSANNGNNGHGTTDYTDYNDPQTDYGNSDYNDPQSDYGNSDYNDPQTDYGNSDYNDPQTDYGNSDYNDPQTDYGNSDYGAPAPQVPAPTAAPAPQVPAPTAAPAPANPPAVNPPTYGGSDSDYSDYDADSGYSDYEGES